MLNFPFNSYIMNKLFKYLTKFLILHYKESFL